MFSPLWPIVGMLLIVFILLDSLQTTLTLHGAGRLSNAMAGAIGRLSMKGDRRLAENASLLALISTFASWSLLLWIGWTLIFCGSAGAVVDTISLAPASFVGRLYFAGFTLTTLGVGDVSPGEGVWRVATVLAATNGFVLLTLFVTYSLSVVTALNLRRAMGTSVGHLGSSPEDIILLLRDGDKQALASRLMSLTEQLENAAVQSDTYPVLEYSHLGSPPCSFGSAVIRLGEVSLLLERALERDSSLPRAIWQPLRSAVNLLTQEGPDRSGARASRVPPPPALSLLKQAGLQLSADADSAFEEPSVQAMRQRWAAWLLWHGRPWESVRGQFQDGQLDS